MTGGSRVLAAACLMFVLAPVFTNADSVPWGDLPALTPPVFATACGQGTSSAQVREICERLAIVCWDRPLLRMGDLGAICCAGAECPFGGVLVVVTDIDEGAMRAVGVDLPLEVARCTALAEFARELGMYVIILLIDSLVDLNAVAPQTAALPQAIAASADLVITVPGLVHHFVDEDEPVPIQVRGVSEMDALFAALFRVPDSLPVGATE